MGSIPQILHIQELLDFNYKPNICFLSFAVARSWRFVLPGDENENVLEPAGFSFANRWSALSYDLEADKRNIQRRPIVSKFHRVLGNTAVEPFVKFQSYRCALKLDIVVWVLSEDKRIYSNGLCIHLAKTRHLVCQCLRGRNCAVCVQTGSLHL